MSTSLRQRLRVSVVQGWALLGSGRRRKDSIVQSLDDGGGIDDVLNNNRSTTPTRNQSEVWQQTATTITARAVNSARISRTASSTRLITSSADTLTTR